MLALVLIMVLLLGWALVAGRLSRWSITAPLAMAVLGFVLTVGSHPVFRIDLDTHTVERFVEIVLAVILFVDATELPGGPLGPEPRLTLRLLFIGLPLSLVVAVLLGLVVLPGHGLWVVAVAAVVIVPTDLAPASAVLRDRRIPRRVRDLLNVESGLNDGFVAPLFLVAVAATETGPGEHDSLRGLVDAIPAVLVALAVGAVVGRLGGLLLAGASARGWTEPSSLRVGVLALPFAAYGAAVAAHGNGFVAAFLAGVFFRRYASRMPADALHLAEDAGVVLSFVLWFLFGEIVVETLGQPRLGWAFLFAGLALTVVRIGPVLLALSGTTVARRDRLFIGWMGPRGIASIVFGLLGFIDLAPPESDFVADVMVTTVLLSVVLHGLTLRPLAALMGRRRPAEQPDEDAAAATGATTDAAGARASAWSRRRSAGRRPSSPG